MFAEIRLLTDSQNRINDLIGLLSQKHILIYGQTQQGDTAVLYVDPDTAGVAAQTAFNCAIDITGIKMVDAPPSLNDFVNR